MLGTQRMYAQSIQKRRQKNEFVLHVFGAHGLVCIHNTTFIHTLACYKRIRS